MKNTMLEEAKTVAVELIGVSKEKQSRWYRAWVGEFDVSIDVCERSGFGFDKERQAIRIDGWGEPGVVDVKQLARESEIGAEFKLIATLN